MDSRYYVDLAEQFQRIERSTTELAFYVPNYALLCVRNAGAPHDTAIPNLFRQAVEAASKLPDDEREEALGHLYYNVARWEHKKGSTVQAYANWQIAVGHRILFLKHLNRAQESRERRLAAAQQVWKMRGDFQKFFPEQNEDDCGVTVETIAELKREFGDAVKSFAAKPS